MNNTSSFFVDYLFAKAIHISSLSHFVQRLLMTWHICVQTTRITNTRECARVHTIQQHKKELRQLLNVVDMNKN